MATPATAGRPRRSLLRELWGRAYGDYPIWKRKLIVHTSIIWVLLAAHAGFLAWSRGYDPNVSSFWGAFGFDVLDVATDCDVLRQQQSAWALAVNILATLLTYVSSDVMLALSAPSRKQLDACHAKRQYMEVGVHSFHNVRSTNFGWKKRVLWGLLSLLVLPFHLIYNSVIIVSQPASESYQISIPDSAIPLASGRVAASSSVPIPNATPSALAVTAAAVDTAIPTIARRIAQPTGRSVASSVQRRIPQSDSDDPAAVSALQVAEGTERLQPWSSFNSWQSAYATSPYLAWTGDPQIDARDPSQWPGLEAATADLDELLSLAYTTNPSDIWGGLSVDSSDWSQLDLDSCRDSFSQLYRSSTGTVVLVISGLDTTEKVAGLSYLSYNWTDLVVSCPTSFLQSTNGGEQVIVNENPPVLPLIFGTFSERKAFGPGKIKLGWSKDDDSVVCPSSYSPVSDYAPATVPRVEGCLIRNRGSECRIGVNILFTVILLIAITLKAICMTVTLFVLDEEPILTVGDAMAEYLERPDPQLAGCSMSWSESEGWNIVDGALMAYQHGRGRGLGSDMDEVDIKDGVFRWLLTWPGRQWRKVWGYRDDGRNETVPRTDVFNNLHTMRSSDSVVWLWFYFLTLAVCFGIFYSINAQDGWIVLPVATSDLYWMLWPTVLCNLPQVFATLRSFVDTWILTSRSSLEEFASYATDRKGLRVSEPLKNTAQRPAYFFGGMNAIVFMTTTGLQTLYAWIISEYAQPQWINPLRPEDPSGFFSPAFLMKIGSDSNRTLAGKICFCLLIALFPFLAVHLVNMTQSLVVRVRALRISDLSTFIPQYIADTLLLRWVAGFGRPEKTAELLPHVPLQMPGPSTSSLVVALACQPKLSERDTGLSRLAVQWGVVRRPQLVAASIILPEKAKRPPPVTSFSSPGALNTHGSLHAPSSYAPSAFSNPSAIRSSARSPPLSTLRTSMARKPVPLRTASPSEDAPMSPTMAGAPHLSGDEAAFATAWMDMMGSGVQEEEIAPAPAPVPPVSPLSHHHSWDEEKAMRVTSASTAPGSVIETETDEGWTIGHCSFSGDEVHSLEPGRIYTGIRRGEGDLTWVGQIEQLLRRFLQGSSESRERMLHGDESNGRGDGGEGDAALHGDGDEEGSVVAVAHGASFVYRSGTI